MAYETGRLSFSESADGDGAWWAVDEHNVEYKVEQDREGWWHALAQRRMAWSSVSQPIGAFSSFEDAAVACSDFSPGDAGILDVF